VKDAGGLGAQPLLPRSVLPPIRRWAARHWPSGT